MSLRQKVERRTQERGRAGEKSDLLIFSPRFPSTLDLTASQEARAHIKMVSGIVAVRLYGSLHTSRLE